MRESTHEAVQGADGDSRGAGQFFCRLWTGGQDIGDAALSHHAQGHGNARTDNPGAPFDQHRTATRLTPAY
jgi:hypothetical protein